jgi:hypothetical protein
MGPVVTLETGPVGCKVVTEPSARKTVSFHAQRRFLAH